VLEKPHKKIAIKLGYRKDNPSPEILLELMTDIDKMLTGLIKSLKK
jgi:hypothetical protein